MIKISPFIYVNLTSASCCFFFLIFLLIAYFSRKNMNNIDNKIYKHMLIINLFTTLFYVLFYMFDLIAALAPDYQKIYPIVYLFSKLAPISLVYWSWFLLLYVYYITHEKNKDFLIKFEKNQKKYFKRMYIFLGILTIFHFMEHTVIDLGTGVENRLLIVTNISLDIALITGIIMVIKNIKKIEKKKALPVLLIVPIIAMSTLGAITGVPIVLLFIMVTAINHLMYHTIENPDLKLINQLELAKNQAEKASKAKSDFLSSMSHELRTPINAISGLSQMINMTDNVDEIHDDSNDILIASEKLLELVQSVLDINKIEANEVEVVNKDYNLINTLNSLSDKISMRIGDKPIEFKTSFSNNIPMNLYGDNEKIRIILTNLLTNAIKYTNSGEVNFIVNSSIDKNKCNLEFIVKDTGRGLKPDQLDMLFTKFYRLEEDRDSNIEGTGLGLAITKSLVELMNGNITVNSEYGVGTTFTVTLSQEITKSEEKVEVL